ncbi:hypothetical protein DSO57_1007809 [Entomophthora muscae]|uniref:Uncharacterized protein n=1 Tax=Entomophthora muscae TaxID=34485 RepID=A0ACC2S9A2_9FUNG|nr:hypothetical protein DSO57_1007809 [Entomophthora muscae]
MALLEILVAFCTVVTVKWLYKVWYSLFFSPLRGIPGPMSFQLIPAYELLLSLRGALPWKEREYHHRYGPVYRKGHTMVQFASEDAMCEIYSTQAYRKSDVFLKIQN